MRTRPSVSRVAVWSIRAVIIEPVATNAGGAVGDAVGLGRVVGVATGVATGVAAGVATGVAAGVAAGVTNALALGDPVAPPPEQPASARAKNKPAEPGTVHVLSPRAV